MWRAWCALLKNARAHSDALRRSRFSVCQIASVVFNTLSGFSEILSMFGTHLIHETFVHDFGPLSKVALLIRVISTR
jgi:hypothetical protein